MKNTSLKSPLKVFTALEVIGKIFPLSIGSNASIEILLTSGVTVNKIIKRKETPLFILLGSN